MMKTTQLPDASSGEHGGAKARWARALVGAAALLLLAPPAWATRVIDVRVGKHPTFTRVVFELDTSSGYQLERSEPAPGIAELVVSLRASSGASEIAVPKNSLITGIELRSDGASTTAHIRLAKSGLRLKEMMLSEPARIVLDVLLAEATPAPVAAVKPKPAPIIEPAPVAVVSEAVAAEVVDEVVSRRSQSEGDLPASPAPYGSGAADAGPGAIEFRTNEGSSDSTAPSAVAERFVPAGKPVQIAMATPQTPSSAAQKTRTTLPPASTTNVLNTPPKGLFSMRNGAYALAGVSLLGAAGYVLARRRRDAVDYEDEADYEEEVGDDNPFAGLGSAAPAGAPRIVSAYDDTTDESGLAVGEIVDDEGGQADMFAGTPSAVGQVNEGPEIVVGGAAGSSNFNVGTIAKAATEGSDMSMDGTTNFGTSSNTATSVHSTGVIDSDAIMRLIREMETRIADVETRLEETVDAKERLERQVAAQTEELRVQRAAIARTQRAVRNMSQPGEDMPTEPALREPRSED